MRAVHVVGGGPAGVLAAFAAMREGAPVRIFEKSAFPRHKVCGEFLSPAILPLLPPLAGCEAGFLQPARPSWSAMRLHFGTRVIRHPLPEPAYGVSRYELDRLLLEHAASAGAQVVREHWSTAAQEHHRHPRRWPQVHRPHRRPSFRLQGPLQRPRQRRRGTILLSKLLCRDQRCRKRRDQRCGLAPSESSDPSAFTPAISSGAAPRSPSACAPPLAPWIG